jgi:hypothetical protein
MLDVIRSLAAEERRLRERQDESSQARLTVISNELTDMWARLRTLRAESGPIDLGKDGADPAPNTLAS